jgi:hypothetical protein
MTGTARTEAYGLPPAILESIANARATLRFIKLALLGLSLEIVDDPSAADVRDLSDVVEQISGRLRAIERTAIVNPGEALH